MMDQTAALPIRHKKVIADGVMGVIFLVTTEIMFFAGLISAYIVNRAGTAVWPPAGQPRLPIVITAFNTAALLASAVMLFLFNKRYQQGRSTALLLAALLLGVFFISVQGTEWVRLIGFGLTTTSSLYGSFFYVLIGTHALHVFAGICMLYYLFSVLKKPLPVEELKNKIAAGSIYWYFVAGIWPVLYILVYLT